MAAPNIYTFLDVLEELNDFAGGNVNSVEDRKISRAALAAYRHVANANDWLAFQREGSISTNGSYDTGTIAYTHSSYTVTLTGGTFPSWAADAEIRINSTSYPIAERTDDTTLVLSAEFNPGEDIAAGETYKVYQNGWRLPQGFLSMTPPVEARLTGALTYVTPGSLISYRTGTYIEGEPSCYSIISDRENTLGSRKRLILWPVPTSARQYRFKLKERPQALRHTGTAAKFYQGTITGSSGGSTITGSGTAFEAGWEGAMLRIGPDGTNRPTGIDGDYPYAEQHIIDEYSSATSVTTTSALVDTYSGRKYVVSDPIDMDDNLMNLFLKRARYELACLLNSQSMNKRSLLEEYHEAFVVALESDCPRMWDPGASNMPAIGIPLPEWTT